MNVFGLAIPDAVIDVAILVLILLGAVLSVSYTHLTLPTSDLV